MGTSLYEQYRASAGEPEPTGSLYDEYLKSQGKPAVPPARSRMEIPAAASESSRALPFNRADRDVNLGGAPDNAGTAVLGTLASLPRDVPGMQTVMAGMRSVVRQQPYREALSDLEEGQRIAGPMGTAARVAGGAASVAAIPGSAAVRGGAYGALKGLAQADPNAGTGERVKDAAIGGGAGAVVGKATEMIGPFLRSLGTKSLGRQELGRTADIKAADRVNYGAARAQGAALPPQSVVALQKPDIKPFADMVRQNRQFANADEGTVLRETYKLMSKQSLGLERQLREQGFDAAKRLQLDNIAAAKQELLDAADNMGMTGLRKAVQVHATKAGERDAMRFGADVARRTAQGTSVTGKKLATQSDEAVEAALAKMSPGAARGAREGMLGRLREVPGVTSNPLTGFGLISSLVKTPTASARLAPFISQLDRQTGNYLPRGLESLLLSATSPEP